MYRSRLVAHSIRTFGASMRKVGLSINCRSQSVGLAGLAAVLLIGCGTRIEQSGASMEPNLPDGTVVAFQAVEPAELRRGDIIVFESPAERGQRSIKRVVGVPGDQVEMKAGLVYVNRRLLAEPYEVYEDSGSFPSTFLAEGEFFLLGDNRRVSVDSRDFGSVPAENIIGRVEE